MTKLRNWVKHLTLPQQLSAILLVTVSFFTVFIFVFLSGNIESFVNSEMLSVIRRNQQAAIANYKEYGTLLSGEEDQTIINVIYVDHHVDRQVGLSLLTPSVQQELSGYTLMYDELVSRTSDGQWFKLTSIDSETKIITMVSKPFQNSFKQMLLEVVYLTLLGMIIMFLLLIIWVGFIIHPLNQIRQYIEKIRKGEEATLMVDRGDEIGELATAVVEMNAELTRQEKVKQEMIQNISHDLKTPIATIKSYGESIKDGIYPYETLEKSVDVIIENANRLEKKVKGLLMLNRIDYLTYMSKEDDTVDMYDVVSKVILSTKQIRSDVTLKMNEKHATFKGSEEPWRVVIENLIENALRYAKSVIEITIDDDRVSVRNDGKPLDDHEMKHLFTPYEKGKEGQFGLGLSIVKKVVNSYGYKVDAENTEDGVIFTLHGDVRQKPRKQRERQNRRPRKEKGVSN